MTKVKICGIRRAEDIEYVNQYLPEYIGFVFAESRRQVSSEAVKVLASRLNRSIKKVGVFLNEDIGRIVDISSHCGLDIVQVHGDETPEYISDLRIALKAQYAESQMGCRTKPATGLPEIWKAVRVKNEETMHMLKLFKADGYLLDTFIDGVYGGAGETFDWTLARDAHQYGKIILAGGLNAQNVQEAIRIVRPFAVDVSSGVETDGCKDEKKIGVFVNRVRRIRN